jgi:GAF domain-containing protein
VGLLSERFREVVTQSGLWTAMRWLNSHTPYRFTAIFRFDGDLLRNVCLVDKQNSQVVKCEDQPITDSYCIHIHDTGRRFLVEDSSVDARVADHPKRGSYDSYYGIPLFDHDHRMIGTVCHFDPAPVTLPDSVVSEFDELGQSIADAALAGIRPQSDAPNAEDLGLGDQGQSGG